MPQRHYYEVASEQTAQFVSDSLLEYLRLIFHFLYRDKRSVETKSFDGIFEGFMNWYDSNGLLPITQLMDDAVDDPTGKLTMNFNDPTAVHNSVFATSANAMTNPPLDDFVATMHRLPRNHGVFANNDIDMPVAQNITQALRTVAGEVIRSSTMLILACDELHKATPNESVESASASLKHLIQTIKGMECNRKLFFEETTSDAALLAPNTSQLTKAKYGNIPWCYYIQFFFNEVGLSDPVILAGKIYHEYSYTLMNKINEIEQRVVPMLQEATETGLEGRGDHPKPYYCTQNYLMYWSHLILTHCESNSRPVEKMKAYHLLFNSATNLTDGRISQKEHDRRVRREWNHKIGGFMYWERRRKEYWEQNRQLRRDGHMLYVYSQKTRHPEYYTHRADTETGQVPLYYNPTDASGRGDLSRHGPDHEFWRQGTLDERRAAAAADAANDGADDRPPSAAHGHTAHAPNAPVHAAPRQPAPRTHPPAVARTAVPARPQPAAPHSRVAASGPQAGASKGPMSKRAKEAVQHRLKKEETSQQDRAQTRAVEAIENSGLRKLAVRQDYEIVEDLEEMLLERIMSFNHLKDILRKFEQEPTKEEEEKLKFLQFWEELLANLEVLDLSMNMLVAELDTTSQDGRRFVKEQTHRKTGYEELLSKFHRVIATPASPAAGSAPLLPRPARQQGLPAKHLPTAPRA